MVVLTPIERETLQFSLHFSQILNVSTFGNATEIYAIVPSRSTGVSAYHCRPEPQQRWYVCENLEISGEWKHKDSVLHKPPEEKVARG